MKKLTFTIILLVFTITHSLGQCETFLGITLESELYWVKSNGDTGLIDTVYGINAIATNSDLGILYTCEGKTIYWYGLYTNTKGTIGTFDIEGDMSSGGAAYNNGCIYVASETNNLPEDIYRIELNEDGKSAKNNSAINITNGNGPVNSNFGDILVEGEIDHEIIYGSTVNASTSIMYFWKFEDDLITTISSSNDDALQLSKDESGNFWAYNYTTGSLFQIDKNTGDTSNTVSVGSGLFSDLGEYTCQFNIPTAIKTFAPENSNPVVYPNPFTSSFSISNHGEKYFLEVYSTLGAKVYSGICEKNITEVDLSEENPGIYIIRIFNSSAEKKMMVVKN